MIARSPGGLDVGRAVAITEQLAATLDAAHRSGQVYGDLTADKVVLAARAAARSRACPARSPGPPPRGSTRAPTSTGSASLLFEMLTGRGPFTRPAGPRDRPAPRAPARLRAACSGARSPSSRGTGTRRPASSRPRRAAPRAADTPPLHRPRGARPHRRPPAAKGSQGRLLFVLAGFAVIVLVAGAVGGVLLLASGGGGDDDDGQAQTPPTTATAPPPVENPLPADPVAGPAIPAVAEKDLESAAKAAGCTLSSPPEEGKEHSPDEADWVYKSNPPTSGTHAPTWAEDGVYPYGSSPNVGLTTHALEHGRINIQYGPSLTKAQFDQLQTLMAEDEGYHQLLFKNQTSMPAPLAAAAWTQLLSCPAFNPKVFDALRAFKAKYTDKAPEQVP